MERPPRPDHPLEYSADERRLLVALVIACSAVVAAVSYWPSTPPPPLSPEEHAAYLAEIEDFVARSRASADSVAFAKAERQRAYAERQERWAAQKEQWAREKAARAARYAARKEKWDNRQYPDRGAPRAQAIAIDYSVPMPAPSSLDANAVDSATLLRLGVPVQIAGRWLKYRRSGGRFDQPADIAKLYGLADTTSARLVVYFVAPAAPTEVGSASESPAKSLAEAGPLDLNTATAEELQSLRGIGAFTAEMIVEYRERLGGYTSVEQVLEARGVRAKNFAAVRERLTVDAAAPARRIAVNRATTYEEWRHPYVEWKKAKVIVANRTHHGPYHQPDDLLRTSVLSAEDVARMAPYLDFSL